MEQIFPLSFELVLDNKHLVIVGFDPYGTVKQIQIPVPIVGLVSIQPDACPQPSLSSQQQQQSTSTKADNNSNSSSSSSSSSGGGSSSSGGGNGVKPEVISFRRCYSGLIFDLYNVPLKTSKTIYKVVTDNTYDLDWFCFACSDVTPLYEHLPPLALVLKHLNIKPYLWIDYMSLAPQVPLYNQLSNSVVTPKINISEIAAQLHLDDFDRRLILATTWCCPINLVDTKHMPLHLITWYFPNLIAKAPVVVPPPVNGNNNNKRFPDAYIAKLFGIQSKIDSNNKDPFFYRLYRLVDMGYYPVGIDVNQAINFDINAYNPKVDNEVHIRKEELFFPPPHLKSTVIRLRQTATCSPLTYTDIYC